MRSHATMQRPSAPEGGGATTSSAPTSAPVPERKTRVLLSMTTRWFPEHATRARQRGYEVTTATNGEDAATVVDTQSFDVVLSDIAMPAWTVFSSCAKSASTT